MKPIAHLFKTQVFQLAAYLGVPESIQGRTPTTDTYSAEQTQEEFFFRLPFEILDTIWYGWEKNIPSAPDERDFPLPYPVSQCLGVDTENLRSLSLVDTALGYPFVIGFLRLGRHSAHLLCLKSRPTGELTTFIPETRHIHRKGNRSR